MATLLPPHTEVLGGLELGGLPIAAVLSQVTGLPGVLVRARRRPYGSQRFVEGVDCTGRMVVLVDDAVSSGQSASQQCRRPSPARRHGNDSAVRDRPARCPADSGSGRRGPGGLVPLRAGAGTPIVLIGRHRDRRRRDKRVDHCFTTGRDPPPPPAPSPSPAPSHVFLAMCLLCFHILL